MQSVRSKFGILITLVLCVLLISTCTTVKETVKIRCMEKQHETSIGYLRKAKAVQQAMYEKQIAVLAFQKESLTRSLCETQRILAAKNDSITVLLKELKAAKAKALRSRKYANKLGIALTDCLTLRAAQEKSCNAKIQYLQQLAAKRDSTLIFYKRTVYIRKNVRKEKVLKIRYMTNRIHTVFTLQKYKIKKKIAVKRFAIGIARPVVK